jgi:hypothetical protein
MEYISENIETIRQEKRNIILFYQISYSYKIVSRIVVHKHTIVKFIL